MKEELQSLLCLKINVEYQKFKQKQIALPAEEVYGNAYQIHCYMCLYENILEICQQLSEDELVSLITFPGLLSFLYDQWLKVENSAEEELELYLKKETAKIHNDLFVEKGGLAA